MYPQNLEAAFGYAADLGFDGVVVSDWTGVRSLESARAAQA